MTDVHALGLDQSEGLYATESWDWDQNDETRAFGKRFMATMKKMPNSNQVGVYSSVLTYLKAVQAANTDDADAVMKQLKSMTISDIFTKNGKIRPDGMHQHDMYLFQVKAQEGLQISLGLLQSAGVIAGDQAFQSLESLSPLVKRS